MFSQEDCAKKLKRAREFYAEGNIEMMQNLLSGCLEEGFTREEKVEARKLLVLASLFDDDLDQADIQMEEFLKLEPEYQVKKGKDQIEFIKLYETFRTTPTFSIGLRGGGNYSMVVDHSNVNVYSDINSTSSYKEKFGFFIGAKIKKQFNKHLALDFSANFSTLRFQLNGEFYDNEMKQVAIETQNWFQAPVSFSYMFLKGRLQPYLGVGASFGYLFSANASYDLSYDDNAKRPLASSSSVVNLTQNGMRERVNYWYNLSTGFVFKIPKSYISLDISYQYNPKKHSVADARYSNSLTYFETLYLDDDFYLDNISVGVSYLYCFYNPKKKRQKSGK